jgi:BirA family biotin operon repressor/biotin-[acetyl-CoA-carboxylase] ligase
LLPAVSLALRSRRRQPVPWAELASLSGLPPKGLAEAVEALGRRGFVIETHPHLGLSLVDVPADLDEAEVAWALPVTRVGRRVTCVQTTTSTNDLAWDAAEKESEASDGLAVFADHQSAGRGRRGSRWLAPRGTSILCSVVVWVPQGPVGAAVLTRTAAVAAAEAVEDQGDLAVGIKWPNDLTVEDRKIGGILVEARHRPGDAAPVVIGIGINCSQRPEAFPPRIRPRVASLAMLGAQVDRTLLARSLLVRLDQALARAAGPEGAVRACGETARRCRTLGRWLSVTEGGVPYSGQVVDLDAEYGLVLRLPDGTLRRFPAMTTHVVSEGVEPGRFREKDAENPGCT